MSFLDDADEFFLDDKVLLTRNLCYERLRVVLREMHRMRLEKSGTSSLSHLGGFKLPSYVPDGMSEIIVEVAPGSSVRKQHEVDFVTVVVPPDTTDGVSTPRALEITLFGETGDAPLHPLLQWPAGQRYNTKTVYSVFELVSFLDKLARHK